MVVNMRHSDFDKAIITLINCINNFVKCSECEEFFLSILSYLNVNYMISMIDLTHLFYSLINYVYHLS